MNEFKLSQLKINNNYKNLNIDFQKIKEGDTNEKSKLILKYLLLIKKFSIVNGRVDEDLMQDIIIKTLTKIIPTYDEKKGSFYKRLCVMANNKRKNYLKHLDTEGKHNINLNENVEYKNIVKDDLNPEKKYLNKEICEQMHIFIRELKPRDKLIINEYYIQEPSKTLKEIGNLIGCSSENIRQRLNKIRKQLKQKMILEGIL